MVQVRVAKNIEDFFKNIWLFRFSLIWAKSFLRMIITLVIKKKCQKKKKKTRGVLHTMALPFTL
jgi:hypothetical protein